MSNSTITNHFEALNDKAAWKQGTPSEYLADAMDGGPLVSNLKLELYGLSKILIRSRFTGLIPSARDLIIVSVSDGNSLATRVRGPSYLSGSSNITLPSVPTWGIASGKYVDLCLYAIWDGNGVVWAVALSDSLQNVSTAVNTLSSYMLLEDSSTYVKNASHYCQCITKFNVVYSTSSANSPVSVAINNFTFLGPSACGNLNITALRGTSAWTWGDNAYGEIGILTRDVAPHSSPTSVVGGIIFSGVTPSTTTATATYKDIAIGSFHSVGLWSNGSAWAWGYNAYGQLGNGTTISSSSPVSVLGGISFIGIAVGNVYDLLTNNAHSIGIRGSDGTAWSWGDNSFGQLGNGTRTNANSPVSVLGGISFVRITAGNFCSLGIRGSDGTVWAWGNNGMGQLGNNNANSYSSPVNVVGGISFREVYSYDDHVIGIRGSDGTAWAWGYNGSGNLGNGSISNKSSPVSVLGGISFKQISVGDDHNVGIRGSDGTAWAWGQNVSGGLGNGSITGKSSPISVLGGISFTFVGASTDSSYGIRGSDGSLWSWGYNNSGQLGIQQAGNRSSPVSVLGGMAFTKVAAGGWSILAIRSDNYVWSWGYNNAGQLGIGTVTSKSSPVSVIGGGTSYKEGISNPNDCGMYYSVGLDINGNGWSWGNNDYGQLGIGTTLSHSSPVSIIGGISFTAIYAGYSHSVGLDQYSIAWSWGRNNYGQLGDNSRIDKNSPVLVAGGMSFSMLSCGSDFTVGINKNNGSLWLWGVYHISSGLTNSSFSSPISVVGGMSYTWASAGFNHVGVISGNKAYCWGENSYGQLGDNTVIPKSIPNAVAGTTAFTKISAGYQYTLAISSSGLAWGWGCNSSYQLGIGNTTASYSSPVSVLGGISFSQIRAGGYNGLAGITSAGLAGARVWTWGDNNYGQLGIGTTGFNYRVWEQRFKTYFYPVGNSSLLEIGTTTWFFQNTAPDRWSTISAYGDALLAVKGGTQAYNVNGGTQAGNSWGTLPSHTHTYTAIMTATNSNGCTNTDPVGSWGWSVPMSPSLQTSSASGISGWRPLANVGIIAIRDY